MQQNNVASFKIGGKHMEKYLYQKEYVMLNNMQLHLSNPEPMLKYIDEKVEKLIKAKSKNEEINIKINVALLKISRKCLQVKELLKVRFITI